ncbi:MAG: hypothetical protein F6K41_44520 [Symploca sp. SIO3E6]|nr:hypothetical protein [Caldora sp. SIO3E6]
MPNAPFFDEFALSSHKLLKFDKIEAIEEQVVIERWADGNGDSNQARTTHIGNLDEGGKLANL